MKKAFTLAEVLITLGIIGVVAAFTLPVLITKYKMKTYEVAFKKEYSTIQNLVNYLAQEEAINQCYAELRRNPNGIGYYSSNHEQCKEFKQALIKNLQLSTINYDKNIYKSQTQVLEEGGMVTNSHVPYQGLIYYFSSYLLPDGAILIMAAPNENRCNNDFVYTNFIIDINGAKAPNKWGYDAFYMTFAKKDNAQNIIINDEFGTLVEKGGVRPKSYLTNQNEKSSAMGL